MMTVTPSIHGLNPQNTIELVMASGKILGISAEYNMNLHLKLFGQTPATVKVKLSIVNNDVYRFEDGTATKTETYTMQAIDQDETPAFRIRNIAHFSKKYPDLAMIVFSWEVQSGEGMADAAGGQFPVKAAGATIKFTKFK